VRTYGSLFEIQPFGNTLYRITVTAPRSAIISSASCIAVASRVST
jgi:hypothetical protein